MAELRPYAPDIDVQRLVNAGVTDIAAVVPPEKLNAVILAYNQALRQIFVSTTLSYFTTSSGVIIDEDCR
jgi:hypothetical protein